MRRLKRLALVFAASILMIIAFSITVFATPQVQEISLDTEVVNQMQPVVVTIKTTEPIANGKLYLEGQYGSASSYTQLTAQLFTKIDDYTWKGTVYPTYVAGYTFYPSWLEYTDLSTGSNRTIFFNKDTFPDARFTVYKDWESELKENVTVAPGGMNKVSVRGPSTSTYDFSKPLATVKIADNSIADVGCGGFGLGPDYSFVDLNVQGIVTGETSIVVKDINGAVCKILEVTVTNPVTEYQTVCVGETISVPVEYNSSGLRYNFSQSVDHGNELIDVKNSYFPYSSQEVKINSNYIPHNSGFFTIPVFTTGNYYLNLFDSSMNRVKSVHLTVQDHLYNSEIVQHKSCNQHEIVEYTCVNCGAKERQEGNDYGEHEWKEEYTVDKEATCTEKGSESIHCSVCNEIQEGSSRTIEKKSHTYSDWKVTKEAGCTNEGSQEKICTNCGDKITEAIPAKGHAWNEGLFVDEEPTCTEDGLQSRHCMNCDSTMDEEIIPATGHTFSDWYEAEASTCEDSGVMQRTCETCGYTESRDLDPTGHIWEEEYTVDVEPKCTTDGSRSIHCQNCDAIRDSEVVAALGHSYGEWKTTKEASCVETGSREKACTACGDTVIEDIPLADHMWEANLIVDIPATCTEEGSQSIHCSVCEEKKDEETVAALGHEWGAPSYTWSQDKSTVTAKHVCRNDKKHTEEETVKATVAETPATVTEAGSKVYTAEFKTEGFTIQTKTETIEKLPNPAKEVGEDGTAVGPGASIEAAEAAITRMKNDNDPAGTVFNLLQLKSSKQTRTSVTLKWKKVKGAAKYYIYGNKCGTKNRMVLQKIATGTSSKFSKVKGNDKKAAKVKKGTYYKFVAVAVDKNGKVISTSKVIHVATRGGKVGNDKSVKVSSSVIKKAKNLKKGKTLKMKAKAVAASSKLRVRRHRAVAYESSNKKIATVTSKGIVKGKKKGTCYVYAYAQNGIFKKIKVVVK